MSAGVIVFHDQLTSYNFFWKLSMLSKALSLLIAISIIVIGLTACSSTTAPIYNQPTEGETASLTFLNATNSAVGINGYNVAQDCSGGSVIFNQKQQLENKETTTVTIAADQAFSFRFHQNSKAGFCSVIATFTPKSNKSYLAYFDDAGSPFLCLADIVSATTGQAIKHRKRIDLVANTVSWLVGDGIQCD